MKHYLNNIEIYVKEFFGNNVDLSTTLFLGYDFPINGIWGYIDLTLSFDNFYVNESLPSFVYSIYLDYYIIFLFIFGSTILSFLLFLVSYVLGTSNRVLDSEKISAYECGFSPINDSGRILDFKLYKAGILFLLFDIEIIFLMPWSVVLLSNSMVTLGYIKNSFPFLITLIFGIYIECKDKIYNW